MSQTVRKVVVASQATNQAKAFQTSATTWGELRVEIASLLTGNVEVINPETNSSFSLDSAKLPTGDFRIFVIPTKNKAGVMSPSQAQGLAKEIGDSIVNAAKKATDEDVSNLRQELVEVIENFFNISLDDDCPECAQALEESKKYLKK